MQFLSIIFCGVWGSPSHAVCCRHGAAVAYHVPDFTGVSDDGHTLTNPKTPLYVTCGGPGDVETMVRLLREAQ